MDRVSGILLHFQDCSVLLARSSSETAFINIILYLYFVTFCHRFHFIPNFKAQQNICEYCLLISVTSSDLPKIRSRLGWDLAEWLEKCACIPKIIGSDPSGGSELTFHSDLLLTARGGSTRALIEFACLPCYPGNTLCSQRLEPPRRAW
jgi:hypothetical protein